MSLKKIKQIIEDLGIHDSSNLYLVRVERGVAGDTAVLSHEPEFKTIGVYRLNKPAEYSSVEKDDRSIFKTPIIKDNNNRSYVEINHNKIYLDEFKKLNG